MERITKYTLALSLGSLMAIGCLKEEPMQPIAQEASGKVEVSFNITVPELPVVTRSSANPTMNSLVIYVFGDSGILKEYEKATLAHVSGNRYTYTAHLSPQSGSVRLHFVANGPDPATNPTAEFTETGLISSFYTENSNGSISDAYWQRLILPYGISNTTSFPDIAMIRNYSRIALTCSASNFALKGFAIVNLPVRGYIAPYCSNRFIDNYENKSYNQIHTEYSGDGRVKDRFYTAIPSTFDLSDKYMYPRVTFDPARPTFIIAYGTFTDGSGVNHDCYYKVNIEDGTNYMPVYRNFKYHFNITKVNEQGASSASIAAQTPGTGNLMVDVETSQTSDVQAGDALLKLQYTSKVFYGAQTAYLNVSYYPDYTHNPNNVDNSLISIDGDGSGDVLSSFTRSGNRFVLQVKAPRDQMQMQEVVVRAGDIHQTITLYSITSLQLSASIGQPTSTAGYLNPLVDVKKNTPVDVYVDVPSGLPHHVFPLVLNIDVAQNTLSPHSNDISVIRTGNDYYFQTILDYDEYTSLQNIGGGRSRLVLHFLTNNAESASAVVVSCPTANTMNLSFRNINPKQFTNLSYGDYSDLTPRQGENINFNFTTTSTDPVTVTLTGLTSNDSRLTLISTDAANGISTYRFTPTNGTNSLSLKTTASYNYLRVGLSANGYKDNSFSLRNTGDPYFECDKNNFYDTGRNGTKVATDPYTKTRVEFTHVDWSWWGNAFHFRTNMGDKSVITLSNSSKKTITKAEIHCRYSNGWVGHKFNLKSGGGSLSSITTDVIAIFGAVNEGNHVWTGNSKSIVLESARGTSYKQEVIWVKLYGLQQYVPAY